MTLPTQSIGHEARIQQEDHIELKLWLRLFSCATQIEDEIKQRLREQFQITLARFDYMAQLYRKPDGLTMGDLSNYLMVTRGNITSLTDELERDGLVIRIPIPLDRRSWLIKLTSLGSSQFKRMAEEHEKWILEFFSGVDKKTIHEMYKHIGLLRQHISKIALTA